MKKHFIYLISAIIAVSLVFVSCSEDENGNNYNGNGYYNGGDNGYDNGDEPPVERRNAVVQFGLFCVIPEGWPGSEFNLFRQQVIDSLSFPEIDTVFMQNMVRWDFQNQPETVHRSTNQIYTIAGIDPKRVFGTDTIHVVEIFYEDYIRLLRLGFYVEKQGVIHR